MKRKRIRKPGRRPRGNGYQRSFFPGNAGRVKP